MREQIPPGVDVTRPSPARVYDYLIGGEANYEVDRVFARSIRSARRTVHDLPRESRAFLGRSVEYLAREVGIDQFIDLGSGLPTSDNVHQVAQRNRPGSHVVYVDFDPAVLAHARLFLADTDDTAFIQADARDVDTILGHPDTRRLIDWSRPVGIVFASVLHFIPDQDAPTEIVRRFADRAAAGSHIVITHLAGDGASDEVNTRIKERYAATSTAALQLRSRAAIQALFNGLTLIEPGLVDCHEWRAAGPVEPGSERTLRVLGGVAVK